MISQSLKRTLMILLGAAILMAGCLPGHDPLDGTKWTLFAYRKTLPLPGTTITIAFENGNISGTLGCNQFSTTYDVDGDSITINPIAMTLMACIDPAGIMEQEQMVAGYLMEVNRFTLEEDSLYLHFDQHETLTFHRK